MGLRCAIFDLDQTLAATSPILFGSWNAAMAAVGRPAMSDEEIVALFGPPEWVALRSVTGERDFAVAFDAYMRHYATHHGEVKVYAGIPELLKELGEHGVFRGMMTGKGRATTEVTLSRLGLRGEFELVLTGDEIRRPKPDPEGLRRVVAVAGVAAEECVMVGDAAADVAAARAAGMRSGAALWDCPWPEGLRAAGADLEFSSVASLRAWALAEVGSSSV